MFKLRKPFACAILLLASASAVRSSECDGWQTRRPEWIFCDDFEKPGAMVGPGRYFEYNNNQGDFTTVPGVGVQSSTGLRARWQPGEIDAGNIKLGFGRSPSAYFSKGIRPNSDFREIFYRVFVRMQSGWKGNPFKLSRATVLAKADWSQAMIAHLWGDFGTGLQLDPARCTDGAGTVKCSGYNDFNNIKWIGAKAGTTPIYDGSHNDKWLCVEAHVRLNDEGLANGVHEYWIDDKLEARREGLDFLEGYKAYGINAVFLENYWNSGSTQLQERFMDNFVVSTQKIGCSETATTPALPHPRHSIISPLQGAVQKLQAGVVEISGKGGAVGTDGIWSAMGRIQAQSVDKAKSLIKTSE